MDKHLYDLLVVGCGYLGIRVASRFRTKNLRVAALTRSAENAKSFVAGGIEPIIGDIRTPLQLPPARCLLYAVGMDRRVPCSPEEFYVEGLRHTLAGLPQSGGDHRFIYVSSTSVYGQTDGSWVTEESATEPLSQTGRALLEAEGLLRSEAPALRPVILRFAGIYGPNRLPRADAIKAGAPIATDPDGWLNLIHVDDGADLIQRLFCEDEFAADTFNVVDTEPLRRSDYCSLLAVTLRAPAPHFQKPQTADPNAHDAANRRIDGRKLRQFLGCELQYPTARVGIPAAVAACAF